MDREILHRSSYTQALAAFSGGSRVDTTKSIGIADLLAQVRAEIDLAQERLSSSGKEPAIDWESAEVEISFAVSKTVDAKGGVNYLIFAVEAGGELKSEEIHRLTIKLKPHEDSRTVNLDFGTTPSNPGRGVAVAEAEGLLNTDLL